MDGDLSAAKPHTDAEHAAHLRTGCDRCLVCGGDVRYVRWTDRHGQSRCSCGTTYQLVRCSLRDDYLAEIGLTKADVKVPYCDCFRDVPLLRAYREANPGAVIPYGDYFGGSPIPESDYEAFWGWCARHADVLRPAWEGRFNWDALVSGYGKPGGA